LSSFQFFNSQLIASAVDELGRVAEPKAMLYRHEFQTVDNALLSGVRGRFPTVGFWHAPWGPNYLPTRVGPGANTYSSHRGAEPLLAPLPDHMIVPGAVGRQRLEQEGYPGARIAHCGPLKHAGLLDQIAGQSSRVKLRRRLGIDPDAWVVFVALQIVETDTEALFANLSEASRTSEPLELVVKSHPNRPDGESAMHHALATMANASLVPPDADLYDYIRAADAMVLLGSNIAFEAIALGVMPVVFENPSTFPANSMSHFEEGLYVVRDAATLAAALRDIRLGLEPARRRVEAWPSLLARTYGDMQTDTAVQLDTALVNLGVAGSP
jgi:hypothetical protein